VNCLIAFTNNPHSMEVALNATAFLRYCATKLAEGAIGELPDALPGGVVEAERLAPTRVVSLRADVMCCSMLCVPSCGGAIICCVTTAGLQSHSIVLTLCCLAHKAGRGRHRGAAWSGSGCRAHGTNTHGEAPTA
jgi:hypothetical protein